MKKLPAILIAGALASALTACNGAGVDYTSKAPSAPPSASAPAPSPSGSPSPSASAPVSAAPVDLPQLSPMKDGEDIAIITTSMGVVKMRFFPQYAPKAVENFITLAKQGYYNGLIFHRVIKDFVIQTGDPKGDGSGGQSVFKDSSGNPTGFMTETSPNLHHIFGAVSMARGQDPSSNGSQFFIVSNNKLDDNTATQVQQVADTMLDQTMKDQSGNEAKDAGGNSVTYGSQYPKAILDEYLKVGGDISLDFNYDVFGQVYDGLDVVTAISNVPTLADASSPPDSTDPTYNKPQKDVTIQKIEISQYKAS